MNILFIGDIVGRPGRTAVKKILPDLRKDEDLDLVIANGENLASGVGMTYETYREMTEAGIDYFTSGHHIWSKKEFLPYLDDAKIKVLRPANYPIGVPGRGITNFKIGKCDIYLINLMGRVFLSEQLDNPFLVAQRILADIPKAKNSIILVDFHAEATSEKNTLGYFLDGKVTAFLGTHTHVPTADYRILPQGTAYISDVGMVGAINSSIGAELSGAIKHFLTGLPFRNEPADGPIAFNAVSLKINDTTNKVTKINLINKIIS